MNRSPSKRRSNFSSPEIKSISRGLANGLTSGQIGKVIGASASTIRKKKQRLQLVEGLPPKEKKSKTKINATVGLAIKQIVRENPIVSVRKIPAILQNLLPSELWIPKYSAVYQYLKKTGISKRTPLLKCPISETNRKKRLDFAKTWLDKNKLDKLGIVFWTDETRVKMFLFDVTGGVSSQQSTYFRMVPQFSCSNRLTSTS